MHAVYSSFYGKTGSATISNYQNITGAKYIKISVTNLFETDKNLGNCRNTKNTVGKLQIIQKIPLWKDSNEYHTISESLRFVIGGKINK